MTFLFCVSTKLTIAILCMTKHVSRYIIIAGCIFDVLLSFVQNDKIH